jgi:hypothetical protein
MNRVEQDDVLHVGERREARGYERDALVLHLAGKARRCRHLLPLASSTISSAPAKSFDQLLDGCFDLPSFAS